MQVSVENRRLVKFIVAAVLFFAWSIIQGPLQAQKPIHDFIAMGKASRRHPGLLFYRPANYDRKSNIKQIAWQHPMRERFYLFLNFGKVVMMWGCGKKL